MVKFVVVCSKADGRIGRIAKWGSVELDHKTPSCMIYTRAGHIPNLTWEVATKWLRFVQPPILQITLPTLYDAQPVIKNYGEGVGKFCGIPSGMPLHLSYTDPLLRLDGGFNNNKSIAIWSKSGRKNVSAFKVDSFETLLDYDTDKECMSKRLTKSLNRTVEFVKEITGENNTSTFLSLGGGFSDSSRQAFAENFAKLPFEDTEENETENETNNSNHLPKIANGPFSPTEIVSLAKLGVDLFDSSFATLLAEEGKLFQLHPQFPKVPTYSLIDLNDEKKYADDFVSPFEDCKCYCCLNYTRGYLQHLRRTNELLGPILLTMFVINLCTSIFNKIYPQFCNYCFAFFFLNSSLNFRLFSFLQ
uniref:TGT domain-containing protein n=1 Tax=Syphacia muris TaxID=451379 RepID=A0A0N5AJK4_9BILA